ncbi:hypothetical protein I4U23_016376 [Adineta vaga]|nr:hypothetical protein I4U23_016376 [Adineta vaga]
MLARVIINFLVYHTMTSVTMPVDVYRNSYFEPSDTRYVLSNLSSISSINDCLCMCISNMICYTAAYYGINQRCILFFAQLNLGQLRVASTSVNASVYSFGNRINETLTFPKQTNETVYSIWNTTAGGDSVFAIAGGVSGSYWGTQPPAKAFDGILTTGYCNHGVCNSTSGRMVCGEKTGFYLKMSSTPKILAAFQIGACSEVGGRSRDPMTITIEGSNLNGSVLTLGSSWTLIYNGTSGLITDPGRAAWGKLQVLSNPSIPFASYRLLVTSKQGTGTCVSYSEVQFIFY